MHPAQWIVIGFLILANSLGLYISTRCGNYFVSVLGILASGFILFLLVVGGFFGAV
jgi:hypothetical protein